MAVAALGIQWCSVTPAQAETAADPASVQSAGISERTDIKGTLDDSLRLLTIQHLWRIGLRDKTQRELGGPFFSDYRRAVKMPRQWADGDGKLMNYVGHPGEGAAAGFIWLSHSRSGRQPFSMTRSYWKSRLAATAWTTAYSLQFEIGPLSEASIGNVGMTSKTIGWTDYVMTPAGGLLVMVGEDALDRFVISKLDNRFGSSLATAAVRMFLNPSRGLANVAAMRAPWHRTSRPFRRER
jgi:hypothetical protein